MRTKADNEKFCSECGEAILAKAEICPKCGCRQPGFGQAPGSSGEPGSLVPEGDRKTKGVAAALAILLGGIGMHKFYLGQNGIGLVYLLFCFTFIPALIGLLEGISYMSMKASDFDARYNTVKPVKK